MARTARRYEKRTEKKSYQIPVCMAAIYARLSVDTDERKSESKEIQQIIDGLFEDSVHRISDYNHYHHVYWQEGETLHQWGNSSVRAVLNRHNYYGDLVQRKYESRFVKGEKGCDVLDESQWIVTPNAHEPIISRELFEKVQIRLKVAQEARSTVVGWEDDE